MGIGVDVAKASYLTAFEVVGRAGLGDWVGEPCDRCRDLRWATEARVDESRTTLEVFMVILSWDECMYFVDAS
jgi:hypothetical protein